MIVLQIIPRAGTDAYKLLRDKVTHEARTWSWANRPKTRLRHVQNPSGYIEVGSADGILVGHIMPKKPQDLFFLVEKFIGRIVAWFEDDLAAINLQFIEADQVPTKSKKRTRAVH
jgi:hypothetical protein